MTQRSQKKRFALLVLTVIAIYFATFLASWLSQSKTVRCLTSRCVCVTRRNSLSDHTIPTRAKRANKTEFSAGEHRRIEATRRTSTVCLVSPSRQPATDPPTLNCIRDAAGNLIAMRYKGVRQLLHHRRLGSVVYLSPGSNGRIRVPRGCSRDRRRDRRRPRGWHSVDASGQRSRPSSV